MQKRNGRPPAKSYGEWALITIRVPAKFKNHVIDVADGYDMTLTEYLVSLVENNAAQTD